MNMKAAASLTGSLLARKGAAYPAAYSAPSNTSNPETPESGDASEPQRAYNDPRVIASAPPPPQAPAEPEPQTQAPEEPAAQMQDGRFVAEPSQPAESAPAAPAALPADDGADGLTIPQVMDKMGRVRLSVRLDPDRYLRVKMASARTRWSAQDIVIAALDRYLTGASDNRSADDGDIDDGDDEDSVN